MAGQDGEGKSAREAEFVYAAARAANLPGGGTPKLGGGRADLLLPSLTRDFVLPFLLAALRPDARRWLGPDRLARLAAALRLKDGALAALLDAVPQPPAALSEAGPWTGRNVPLLGLDGRAEWIEIFWRPDRGQGQPARASGKFDRGGFAIRLTLPTTGRIEIRGRLEDGRLDAVMEIERALPRRTTAEMVESFDAVLQQLRLTGQLTIGGTSHRYRT